MVSSLQQRQWKKPSLLAKESNIKHPVLIGEIQRLFSQYTNDQSKWDVIQFHGIF